MNVFRRSLTILMAASAVVCGCSCSPKGSPASSPNAAPPAQPSSPMLLTGALARQVKGHYSGSLTVAPVSGKLADVSLTIEPVFSGAMARAAPGGNQEYNAKLEVSNSQLSVSLVSQQIQVDPSTQNLSAIFVIQNPQLRVPLKLKLEFAANGSHLQGALSDASDLNGIVSGENMLEAVSRHHHTPVKAKPTPAPAMPKAPDTEPVDSSPVTSGTLFVDLNLDAAKPAPQLTESRKIPAAPVWYYSGSTTFGGGNSRNLDLKVQGLDGATDGALYGMVATRGLNRKLVTVELNYGSSAVITFVPALMDPQSGFLEAVSILGTSATDRMGILQVNCSIKAAKTLDCAHLSNSNQVAQSHLTLAYGPSPATPPANGANSVDQLYKGVAQFKAGDNTAVDLHVAYNENSNLSTILSLLQPLRPHSKQLGVTFYINGSVSGVQFADVVLNEQTQTLTASKSFTIQDTKIDASLVCTGFVMGSPGLKFQCFYRNSQLPAAVPFQFPGN